LTNSSLSDGQTENFDLLKPESERLAAQVRRKTKLGQISQHESERRAKKTMRRLQTRRAAL